MVLSLFVVLLLVTVLFDCSSILLFVVSLPFSVLLLLCVGVSLLVVLGGSFEIVLVLSTVLLSTVLFCELTVFLELTVFAEAFVFSLGC